MKRKAAHKKQALKSYLCEDFQCVPWGLKFCAVQPEILSLCFSKTIVIFFKTITMFFQNDHYVFSKRSLCFFSGRYRKNFVLIKRFYQHKKIHQFFRSEQSAFFGIGKVFQHVFNVFAGCEYHLCPSNGWAVHFFGGRFSLAADAHPKAARFAQAYDLPVGQCVLHHVNHGIQHGADVGAAHGTDFLNGFGQSGKCHLSARVGRGIELLFATSGHSGMASFDNFKFVLIIFEIMFAIAPNTAILKPGHNFLQIFIPVLVYNQIVF